MKQVGLLQVLTISILRRFLFFDIHTVPTSPQALLLQPSYDQHCGPRGAGHSRPTTQCLQSLLVAWPLNVMVPLWAQTLKTCQKTIHGYSSRGFTGVISSQLHQLFTWITVTVQCLRSEVLQRLKIVNSSVHLFLSSVSLGHDRSNWELLGKLHHCNYLCFVIFPVRTSTFQLVRLEQMWSRCHIPEGCFQKALTL